jgi:anti-sigma factor RsiW
MNHQEAVSTLAAERYLLGEMSEADRQDFEAHYFDCAECADEVVLGAKLRDGVQAGLAEPVVTREPQKIAAFVPKRVFRPSVFIPWAAAAALAITTGYQALVVVPSLRTQLGPQVLTPITLRPAARGAEPSVAVASQGPVVLAVDASGVAAGTRLTYDLRAADGASVASGAASAPTPGAPLLLLFPGSAFSAPGSYVLTLRGGDASSPVIVDYRFAVSKP